MDSLREFLETSTIHGLAHISSDPSKLSKGFWLFVVFFGFSTASYLINSSYDDWQASPIATSISTHPISELEFPTVTVCPPENSNTALNYDLMRARNITLTDKDREALINLTKEMLIDKPSSEFVKLARALANQKNILKLFENKPSVTAPLPYVDPSDNTFGYEIWSSQLKGSFHTPGFGGKISCNESFDNVHFVLQLSSAVMEKAGNDAIFDIEIKVQNHEG